MSEFSGIKNIVFDLGVVLLDLDYDRPVREFEKLGITDHQELYSEESQILLFDRFERGEIEAHEFLDGLRDLMPGEPDDQSIIDAWNTIILTFPQANIDLLNGLRYKYKLYLLSNTNTIHLTHFHQLLEAEHGLKGLDQFFETIYYSCLEGMRKPEAALYLRLLEQEGLNASETVFIDDMKKNIDVATTVGMKGLLLEVGTVVTELFDENLRLA